MLKAFLPRSGIRQGCLLLPHLSNTVWEVLGTAIREEREINGIETRMTWYYSEKILKPLPKNYESSLMNSAKLQ